MSDIIVRDVSSAKRTSELKSTKSKFSNRWFLKNRKDWAKSWNSKISVMGGASYDAKSAV